MGCRVIKPTWASLKALNADQISRRIYIRNFQLALRWNAIEMPSAWYNYMNSLDAAETPLYASHADTAAE
jgi:hypothetical protein